MEFMMLLTFKIVGRYLLGYYMDMDDMVVGRVVRKLWGDEMGKQWIWKRKFLTVLKGKFRQFEKEIFDSFKRKFLTVWKGNFDSLESENFDSLESEIFDCSKKENF